MLILTIRTDKPEAEVGLYNKQEEIEYVTWYAHRKLAETLHATIKALLERHKKSWDELEGIVYFKGPGSFTGLRIGASVANALAYSFHLPIIGAEDEEQWRDDGIEKLISGKTDTVALPEYGALAHITLPRK